MFLRTLVVDLRLQLLVDLATRLCAIKTATAIVHDWEQTLAQLLRLHDNNVLIIEVLCYLLIFYFGHSISVIALFTV